MTATKPKPVVTKNSENFPSIKPLLQDAVTLSFNMSADTDFITSFLVETLGFDPEKNKQKIGDTLKNKKLLPRLTIIAKHLAGADKTETVKCAALLYDIPAKIPVDSDAHLPFIVDNIMSGKVKLLQLEALGAALKASKGVLPDEKALVSDCGFGVFPTAAEIKEMVAASILENKETLVAKRYTHVNTFTNQLRTTHKWADRGILNTEANEQIAALLGPKTEADNNTTANKSKMSKKELKKLDEVDPGRTLIAESIKFPAPEENTQVVPGLLEAHLKTTGGKVICRFPPEPNGYLHIGHAKAMSLDFGYAKKMGGHCYLRFDDTNPEAESQEYIDSIQDTVKWMGHEAWKVTHAADYFDDLYNLAVELIRRGKAYVCHQKSEDVSESREKGEASPWRERPIEESLALFEDMKNGKFKEGEATLRMKMDINSPNPCMWDLVAYRIKFHPHPHCGEKWCIYPSYDFTHCLNDSLENITHSLCTLEFNVRRESYYWLIDALGLYRPLVWEYARLNLTHTVLSKRRLIALVKDGHVNGWDDPRMPTIVGYRRRGYTAKAINSFCENIGVTRADGTIISIGHLENHLREDLNLSAHRVMAILEPLKITLTNLPAEETVTRPNIPETDKGNNTVPLSATVWVEKSDFKEVDVPNYFGLALKSTKGEAKWVRLKYGPIIAVTEVEKDASGNVVGLKAVVDVEGVCKKPAGNIHWVSVKSGVAEPAKAEVRLYDHLFKSENPGALENYLSDLNPNSLVKVTAYIDEVAAKLAVSTTVQFERTGYFCVDPDSKDGALVFNRSVTLKESKEKPK